MPPGPPFRYDVLEKSCTRLLPFPAAAEEDVCLRAPPLHPSSIRATAGHCYHVQRSMPQSAPLLLHEVQSESPRSSPNSGHSADDGKAL